MASKVALRFGSKLREIRIHLCQKSSGSEGVRNFIEKYYVDLKQANPNFPILVRECSGIQPKLYARYEFGKECSVVLDSLKAEDILQQLKAITQK